MIKNKTKIILIIIFLVCLTNIYAQTTVPKFTFGMESSDNPQDFSITIKILLLMTILSLAPSILIMMTCFTRIIIVFHFLRNALATQTVPSNQILVGLALFITFFIMKPVINEVNTKSIQPYINNEITQEMAFKEFVTPIKTFMLNQTRESELQLFINLRNEGKPESPDKLTLSTIIPAFIISEIKTAFQIGFLLYLPMLLIDVAVASVLLSMGMMMLPPMMISMPMKILLFVLVDGWYLLVESLVKGFI